MQDYDDRRAETMTLASLNRTIKGYDGEVWRTYSGTVDVRFPDVHKASVWAHTFGMSDVAKILLPTGALNTPVTLTFRLTEYAESLDLFIAAHLGEVA